jgi:formate/nitrite transporter FocA (FNT family)
MERAGSDVEAPADSAAELAATEAKTINRSSRLTSPIIYEVLRREGEQEMERPLSSLWWSGVAAGLSLSLSLLAQAVLQSHLPDAPWRPLVSSLGYCLGFLVAVMARHQLFTENTITPVLPLAAEPTLRNLGRMGRLWGVVLAANFTGTFCAALFYTFSSVISPDVRAAMLEIAGRAMGHSPGEMFSRAVAAGFVIAAMVWLLPSAGPAQPLIVIVMTYLVAAAEFAHIIAGSLEAFMLVLAGRLEAAPLLVRFAGPALAGNIIGGTLLFALISYAQVAEEI